MAKQNVTFLGYYNGTGKNGNPFSIAYFYGADSSVKGFRSLNFFLNDDDLKKKIFDLKPLTECVADIRYISKQNVLIDIF